MSAGSRRGRGPRRSPFEIFAVAADHSGYKASHVARWAHGNDVTVTNVGTRRRRHEPLMVFSPPPEPIASGIAVGILATGLHASLCTRCRQSGREGCLH